MFISYSLLLDLGDYMDFLELAKKRKTTYDFDERELSKSDIKLILEAGRWAPSCTNSQPWNFIIVKNKKAIDKLVVTANYGDFHSNPTLIIAIVLRQEKCLGKGHSCFRGKDSGVYDSYMSCGMAALQMILEAADLNIDSCILTPEQYKVKKVLKIKSIDAVPLLVGFGYQKNGTFQKKRKREELKKIVFYDFFRGK